MSRQDQINAKLASHVAVHNQNAALAYKNGTNDDRLAILTDDEAIIIAGRIYSKVDNAKDVVEWVAIGLGGLGVLLSIGNSSIAPLIICAIVAIGGKYFLEEWLNKGTGAEVFEALCAAGEAKKNRLGIGRGTSSTSQEETTSKEPLTDNPASVFERPRRR